MRITGNLRPVGLFGKNSRIQEKSRHQSLPEQMETVHLSRAASKGFWGSARTLAVSGLAALNLAGMMVSPAAAQTLCMPEHSPSAPVELIRQNDGKVVLYTGIGDEVVDPHAPKHYEAPGAPDAAWMQRGRTVCQQAQELGGHCNSATDAVVPSVFGPLRVQQSGPDTLDTYSESGGYVRLRVEAGGVDVKSEAGNAFFYNNGDLGYY